jgi:O-antigen/teichoic acid export membrane protein
VLSLPFMIVTAALGAGPRGFLAANVMGFAGTIVIMLVLLFPQSPGLFRFEFDVFKQTFSYSTRAYLATLAGFVVLRMNVFTLGAVSGPEQVGFYSIASQISDPIAILPQSIALVLFPRLAALQAGRLRTTMGHAVGTGLVLGAICLGLWIFADPAIRFAFGLRFAPAAPVLRAMLPGVLFLGIMSVVSQYLAASGFPISVVLAWIGAVAVSGLLGRTLVASYGAFGAAATLSATYALLLIVLSGLCWRHHHE